MQQNELVNLKICYEILRKYQVFKHLCCKIWDLISKDDLHNNIATKISQIEMTFLFCTIFNLLCTWYKYESSLVQYISNDFIL